MSDAVRLLTLADVAARLVVSRRTVERLVASRELRVVRFGRVVRVTDRELATFVSNRERAERRA